MLVGQRLDNPVVASARAHELCFLPLLSSSHVYHPPVAGQAAAVGSLRLPQKRPLQTVLGGGAGAGVAASAGSDDDVSAAVAPLYVDGPGLDIFDTTVIAVALVNFGTLQELNNMPDVEEAEVSEAAATGDGRDNDEDSAIAPNVI